MAHMSDRLSLPAVRVSGYETYMHWSPVRFGAFVPLVVEPRCLCDETELAIVAVLVSDADERTIRVGCCPTCGYIGYIDRVERAWLTDYYATRWDTTGDEAHDVAEEIRRRADTVPDLDRRKADYAVTIVTAAGIDPSETLCEIGTGFGYTLERLSRLGFARVIGVEPSEHRAAVTNGAYGFDVVVGSFGEGETTRALAPFVPLGVLYSSHVLEHVYDPNDFFAAAAELQEPGGRLVISVPNFFGEPTAIALFQLVHQHIFTPRALARLAARHGYSVANASFNTTHQVSMIFRKEEGVVREKKDVGAEEDYVGRTITKFAAGLGLVPETGSARPLMERLYRALMRQKVLYRTRLGAKIHWWFQTRILKRKKWPMAVVCRIERERRIPATISPIEIRFSGPITMLYQ